MDRDRGADFLTVTEAAAAYGVSRVTIHRLLKSGRLAAWGTARDARVKLIKRRDLDRLFKPTRLPMPSDDDAEEHKSAA